tara:strand:+ start:233 stop:448 length:216 start_codon:yes stop_codon:yes gene_type:complete
VATVGVAVLVVEDTLAAKVVQQLVEIKTHTLEKQEATYQPTVHQPVLVHCIIKRVLLVVAQAVVETDKMAE